MNRKMFKKFSEMFKTMSKKLDAKEAYLLTHYCRIVSEDNRLKEFKDKIDALISAKCTVDSYCCVMQVPDDLLKFIGDIINEYRELGYTVVNLKEVIEDVDCDYLFFCWDKKY